MLAVVAATRASPASARTVGASPGVNGRRRSRAVSRMGMVEGMPGATFENSCLPRR